MEDRLRIGTNALRVAISGNIFLALIKVSLGIIGHSIALISDGVDTTIDIAKNAIAFRGTKIAAQPADKLHPYGHGRAETITSSIIGISVLFAGIVVLVQSIQNFGKTNAQDMLMFIGAIVSITGKILLSVYMIKIGKSISNSAIIANAKDYLGDVLSSMAVLIGALLIRITGKVYYDSIASMIVSIVIMYMGYEILKPSVREMMEEQDNPDIIKKVEDIVSKCAKADNPHKIRTSRLGSYYIVDMHIEFPENMSVKEAHEVVDELERKIKEGVQEVHEVIIHIEPKGYR